MEKGDGETAIIQCRQLLNSDSDLIRKGDIFSVMVEYLLENNNWNGATQLLMEMKKVIPLHNLTYYIPKGKLAIFKLMSLTLFYSRSRCGEIGLRPR